jgi:hypothetical protein
MKKFTKEVNRFLNDWVKGKWEYDKNTNTFRVIGQLVKREGYFIEKIPIKITEVTGDVKLRYAGIKYLEGFPYRVGGNLDLSFNPLVSLENITKCIGGDMCIYGSISNLDSLYFELEKLDGILMIHMSDVNGYDFNVERNIKIAKMIVKDIGRMIDEGRLKANQTNLRDDFFQLKSKLIDMQIQNII